MTNFEAKALLPTGMSDLLPPQAQQEADAVEHLMRSFGRRGYERVKPPLLEFEESLFSGAGQGMETRTFRLMDPASRRMLGLRADMTPQVARIAATRLINRARPLRLSYAGEVLRVSGGQLRPERQFGQVGAELIGSDAPEADAEVILMAVDGLSTIGVQGLSIDLGSPRLVVDMLNELDLDAEATETLRAALDRKDAAFINGLADTLGQSYADLFEGLLQTVGPASDGLKRLAALDLPESAKAACDRVAEVHRLITEARPDLNLTLDIVDNRGHRYHTGLTFTIFAGGVRGELGSGGRYLSESGTEGASEPATGLTLFMDTVLRASRPGDAPNRLYLPPGTPPIEAETLRADGWITVSGLEKSADAVNKARALGCSHLLKDGKPVAIGG